MPFQYEGGLFGGAIRFKYDDGGRAAAGFKGTTGDCTCRAIAIATGKLYREVYDALNVLEKDTPARSGKRKCSARTGVRRVTYDKYLLSLGWKWTPTMKIGQGCRVHLRSDELPSGRLVCIVSKHMTAVIDGVIYDSYDPSRDGSRCVYGYWSFGS